MIRSDAVHKRFPNGTTAVHDLPSRAAPIRYVIRQAGLFPHRTVLDNIATVPLLLGRSRGRDRARAAELLETVGDGAPPDEQGG